MIPSFKQYLIEEEREIFFTFGRMNPPTIGHEKLFNALARKAGKNPYKIFLSQSQDKKKNPLLYQQKIKHSRKMFPKHARNIILNKKIKTVFDAAVNLYDQGYKKVTMIVGDDRVIEFQTLLNKYNSVKGRHGFYNFEKIRIVSAGARDPDSEGVEGMSASKQRSNVATNNFTAFVQGIPSKMSNAEAKKLFNDLRAGMGLREATDFKQRVNLGAVSETREKYINGELFEPGDRVVVKENGKPGYIYRLGANYVIVALDEGKVTRQWLDGIVFEKTDQWYKNQPEWGTPASTKKAKRATPGQQEEDLDLIDAVDPVKMAKDKINREKGVDARKHDKMLDRARLARARTLNRQSVVKPDKDKKEATFDRPWNPRNPVAKNARKFNKAAVHTDKKKADKKGYIKHTKNYK